MYLTVVLAPHIYDNVYKVWCPKCRAVRKIVDPKTLQLPPCPTCSCQCLLKPPVYTEHSFLLKIKRA